MSRTSRRRPLKKPGIEDQYRILRHNPHSFAFVMDGADSEAESGGSKGPGEANAHEPQFFGDFGEEQRKRKVQQWLDLLESDLGVKVIAELPEATDTG